MPPPLTALVRRLQTSVRPLPAVVRRPRIWIIAAGLLVTYTAAGFWLVPRLISSGVRDAVATRYHRTAQLGKVTFNPFTLELEARNFALPDADGGPLLAFDRLYINLALVSVLRAGLEFQSIALDGPHIRIVRRNGGRINIQDLLPPPDSHADKNAKPPRLWITELAVRAGDTTVLDLDRPSPLTLTLRPITFTLRKFSTRSEGNAYVLAAQSTRGERLGWRGTFGLAPVASRGTFSLSRLQAKTIAEIGAENLPFELSSGELDLDGSYDVAERGDAIELHAMIARLVLSALGIRARGTAKDAVSIPKLTLTNTAVDVAKQTVAIEHVALDELHVAAVRNKEGEINLQHLLGKRSSEPAHGKPWSIEVPDIRLARADFSLEDERPTHPAKFRLAPFNLTVGNLAVPTHGPLALTVDTAVNDTGHFNLTGELTVSPLAGHFNVEAAALPLAAIQPYLDDVTGMILRSGGANMKGAVTLAADGGVAFDGRAGVDDLSTVDNVLEEDFIKWKKLELVGLRAHSSPPSLEIAEVVATEPYARVIMGTNGVTNLTDVLSPQAALSGGVAKQPPAAASKTAPPPEPREALPIEIGQVKVDNGSLNFADLSIKPNFETGIRKLSGSIKGLSAAPDARADVKLAGEVDRYTPVKITGKVNYFAAVTHTQLHMSFKNLELTSLSPYSGKFAGYAIERGKLNVDLNYLIEKRRLNAKHKIVVNQLQLGAAVESKDATSLPVKLAVALLKDRNGVIDLDLPVSGNLDDPKFRLGPIIWQVVVNLIMKVVTSPFALLGSLFGGGEEISYIDFAAGSATIDAAAKTKLETLAKALDSRPALNLDVPIIAQPDADRAALAELHWHDEIYRRARQSLGKHATDKGAVQKLLATPKDYRALLETSYRQVFGKRPEIPQLSPPPPAAKVVSLPRREGPGHGGVARQNSAVKKIPPPPPVVDADAIPWLERALKTRIGVTQLDLDTLAQSRAESVQGLILDGTGIDPGRVFVIASPPLTAAKGPVRMQLSLH